VRVLDYGKVKIDQARPVDIVLAAVAEQILAVDCARRGGCRSIRERSRIAQSLLRHRHCRQSEAIRFDVVVGTTLRIDRRAAARAREPVGIGKRSRVTQSERIAADQRREWYSAPDLRDAPQLPSLRDPSQWPRQFTGWNAPQIVDGQIVGYVEVGGSATVPGQKVKEPRDRTQKGVAGD